MWESFLNPSDVATVPNRADFELALHQYLTGQPTLAGLLQYLPAGLLIRVHVSSEGNKLSIEAVKVPKNSVIFIEGEELPMDTGPDSQSARRSRVPGETEKHFLTHVLKGYALRFYFTLPREDILARRGQTRMIPVAFARLTDLVADDQRQLSANFDLPPLQWLLMCGASNTA